MGFKRPCINCGTLVEKGNRCQEHQSQYIAKLDERRKPNRTHYSGDYRKRAKQVRKYLIYNGIHPSRMTAEGYGNTKPIFPNPKQAYEEQANRRVEILIK